MKVDMFVFEIQDNISWIKGVSDKLQWSCLINKISHVLTHGREPV